MTWNEITSAVCIVLSALIFSVSLQLSHKKQMLIVQLFSSFFYIANYAFVISTTASALMATITASCEAIRLVVFFFIEKSEKYNTKKVNLVAGISFCVFLTTLNLIVWDSFWGLLPLIGGNIVNLALGAKNIVFVKLACVIQALLIVIYLFVLSLWINAASQVYVLILGIIGLLVSLKKQKTKPTSI